MKTILAQEPHARWVLISLETTLQTQLPGSSRELCPVTTITALKEAQSYGACIRRFILPSDSEAIHSEIIFPVAVGPTHRGNPNRILGNEPRKLTKGKFSFSFIFKKRFYLLEKQSYTDRGKERQLYLLVPCQMPAMARAGQG